MKKFLWGIGFLLLVFGFTCFFYYINEPYGDVVLSYYDGYYDYYGMEYNEIPIKLEGTRGWERAVKGTIVVYFYFGGRVSAYCMGHLLRMLSMLSPMIVSMICAGILIANVFLVLCISFRGSKKALCAPLFFLLIFLANYWYRGAGTYYVYMMTMVYTYCWPVFLGLLYYYITESGSVFERKKEIQEKKIWIIQILGFITGMGHEILSLMILGAIAIKWCIGRFLKKREIEDFKIHAGYMVGYCFCFFAPGNFRRAARPHDAITAAYSERLYGAFLTHYYAIKGTRECTAILLGLIVCVVLVLALYLMRKKGDIIVNIFLNNVNLLLAAILSIPIWALMPSCPLYGTFLFSLLVYAFLVSFSKEVENIIPRFNYVNIVGSICVVVFFIVTCSEEVRSFAGTTFERRRLVKEAVALNLTEVEVPRYNDSLNNGRYLLSYLNNQAEYDLDYYIDYYGVRLIIK